MNEVDLKSSTHLLRFAAHGLERTHRFSAKTGARNRKVARAQ
jgi:hypothetical protein